MASARPSGPTDTPLPRVAGFDAERAGKPAECDGGGPVAATGLGAREEFSGVLTGQYVDHGDPPWRWYLMTRLARKPQGYPWDAVWCESGNLYLVDG